MATAAAGNYTNDQSFFRRMAVGMSVFIVFAFVQFSARGFVEIPAIPWWVHLHAIVFVGWLALFVTQNVLAERGSLALHRKLGWLGVGLVVAMVVIGSFTSIWAIELNRQPPFFTQPYFLALTHVGVLCFAGLVAAAIIRRRETEWHRRLMLAATAMLLEPALGRVLPMPLLGGDTGEWYVMIVQLAVLAIAMQHDRKHLGTVHPALLWGAAIVVGDHVAVSALAQFPPVIALAAGFAGA